MVSVGIDRLRHDQAHRQRHTLIEQNQNHYCIKIEAAELSL